VEHK
jgi:hypothetical protein